MRLRRNIQMTILYLVFTLVGVIMLFPFVWMIATSFKTGTDIYNMSLIPKTFTLENYVDVIQGSQFPRWYLNSFIVAFICTASVLVFDPLIGYVYKLAILGKPAADVALAFNLGSTGFNAVISLAASVAVYAALRPALKKDGFSA